MPNGFNGRTWLDWLVKVRILIITCLLCMELAMTRLTDAQIAEHPFIIVVVLWYAMSAAYFVLLHKWGDVDTQAKLQIAADLLFATAIVHFSGGLDTSFNFLYPLIIIVAAILLLRMWAVTTALLAFVLFGSIVELEYFGAIPSYASSHPGPSSLQATILINLFAYIAIGYLAGRLTAKLRETDVELQDKSGELQNLQALHHNIIHSMTGGLITTDEEGRITLLNPAGARMLGRPERTVLGRPVGHLFLDRLPAAVGGATRAEVRTTTPMGKEKMLGITAAPIDAPERGLTGYIYTFNDLTEVRRLEREVRTRERLTALGRMAEGIAHEIRQPLSSISGSLKVLAAIAALNEEQRKLVEIVIRESVRLNNIINEFFAYAREKTYAFSAVDLRLLLDDTLTLLENRIVTAGGEVGKVSVIRDFEPEQAPAKVDGDRIKQVFWNICNNSLKAMPEGGTLKISLRASDDKWLISFADTGPGMTRQQMEKVFEPYQSWFKSGTGLGLAISYQIIQAHDGKISVHSEPGEGAEFVLEFKRAESELDLADSKTPAERVVPVGAR